jgi:TRAP-type C4-dicarboxylate transport system substrate-binding protein
MKTHYLLLAVIILSVCLVFSGCTQAPSSTTQAPSSTTQAPSSTTQAPSSTTQAQLPVEQIKLLFANDKGETGLGAPAVIQFLQELEKRSNGRVKINYSWNGALGAPREYTDMLFAGVYDIGLISLGLAGGLFPMQEMCNLPWSWTSSVPGTKSLMKVYKEGYYEKDLANAQVKIIYTAAPPNDPLIFATKNVKTLADLNNLKIKVSQGVMGDRIKAAGAVPVSMMSAETYLGLQKGIVDGGVMAWEGQTGQKLYEVTKYALEPGFGSINFQLAINKGTWNKLPTDIQTIINNMADEYSLILANEFDRQIKEGRDAFIAHGGQINTWSAADLTSLSNAWQPLWDKWIADREAKGLPAKKAVETMYNSLKELGVDPVCAGYTPPSAIK